MTAAMAHELGHTYRLDDCYPSCNGKSVMGAQMCNASGGLCVKSPTNCDDCVVQEVFGAYHQGFVHQPLRPKRVTTARGRARRVHFLPTAIVG